MKNLLKIFFGAFLCLYPQQIFAIEKTPLFQNPPKKLNILLIVTDDHGLQAGFLGTQGLYTPNIDKLAQNGMAFTKAFCTFSSCSPSRAGIMTGTFPHVNGITTNVFEFFGANPTEAWIKSSSALNNQFHVKDSISTLIEVLKNEGYFTGISSKFHIAPHKKFPFDFWTKNISEQNADEFFSKTADKPFFFAYNSRNPHRPFVEAKDEARVLAKLKENKLQVPPYLPNTPLMQKDWAEYLVAIENADADVAEILEILKKRKLDENTLVIFVGDNGSPFHRGKFTPYNLGNNCPLIISGPGVQKNVVTKTLASFTDIMPTILEMANIKIPNSVNGKSLKSIISGETTEPVHEFVVSETAFPRKSEPNYQARSLFDERFLYVRTNGKPRLKLNPADMYVEKGWNNHSYQATMEAKNEFPLQYKLLETLENSTNLEELFDLHSDPWCMIDISKNPDFVNVLNKLRKNLDTWISETNDLEMLKN